MKKGLIVVLLLASMNVWGQSYFFYGQGQEWVGGINYLGSGRATFDKFIEIVNGSGFRRIERASNEQINLIKYGLQQYTVRTNDVYSILFTRNRSNSQIRGYSQTLTAIVIITSSTSGSGYDFTYYLSQLFPHNWD
jgi:hypothetical protein